MGRLGIIVCLRVVMARMVVVGHVAGVVFGGFNVGLSEYSGVRRVQIVLMTLMKRSIRLE